MIVMNRGTTVAEFLKTKAHPTDLVLIFDGFDQIGTVYIDMYEKFRIDELYFRSYIKKQEIVGMYEITAGINYTGRVIKLTIL